MTSLGASGACSLRGRALHKEKKRIGDLSVCYELIEASGVYLVTVSLEKEVSILCSGREERWVRRAFALLVEGGVTPCTAADVWEDLHADFAQDSLQTAFYVL